VEQGHRKGRYTLILEILTDFLACIRCDPSFIPQLLKYCMQWRGNEVCGAGEIVMTRVDNPTGLYSTTLARYISKYMNCHENA
jgi:hypothetical protein